MSRCTTSVNHKIRRLHLSAEATTWPYKSSEWPACLDTEKESNKVLEDPRPKITIGPRKTCDEHERVGGVSPKASSSSWSAAVPLYWIVCFYKFWWLRLFYEKSRVQPKGGGSVPGSGGMCERRVERVTHCSWSCSLWWAMSQKLQSQVVCAAPGMVWECLGRGSSFYGSAMESHLDLLLTFTNRCTERHPPPPASAAGHAIWSL